LNLGIKKIKNQRRGKIPAGAPLGIKSLLGTGMGGEIFPRSGERGGDGGRGCERGRGWGLYSPFPPRPVVISITDYNKLNIKRIIFTNC